MQPNISFHFLYPSQYSISIRSLIGALVLLLFATVAQAQPFKIEPASSLEKADFDKLHLQEDTLTVLAFMIVNDSIEQERFAACKQMITRLVKALKTPNSFSYPFDRLKSISILTPPDSSFRIFTWQLFVNDSTYRYYGAIQRNNRDLQLFPLIDRSADMEYPLPVSEPLPADRWYGSLYYTMRQFDTKQGRRYLLIGYDAFSFFEKRKIVDVLSFDASGKPVFGAPIFKYADEKKNQAADLRLFLQYSAEATVRCNWDEEYQMILFDHLIPMASPFGRTMTAVPDGSYDGLKLEKGQWQFIEKVFNDAQQEAPTIEVLKTKEKGKDVTGRQSKKNKKA